MRYALIPIIFTLGGCVMDTQEEPEALDEVESELAGCYPSITAKYQALGGVASALGAPTSDEVTNPDGIGHRRHYQHGIIYWHPQTCAFEVRGAILGKYGEFDWERGSGYPISDEESAPDGRGRYSLFALNNAIYWSPETGAHRIRRLLTKWRSLDGIWGMGYPVSEELYSPKSAFVQEFQNGVMYQVGLNSYAVYGAINQLYKERGRELGPLGLPKGNERSTCFGIADRCQMFEHNTVFWRANSGAFTL